MINAPQPDYRQQIDALLANYEDGYGVFTKQHWDTPLMLKPGAMGEGVTDNWMALMERVTGIIARGKYGLDPYENEIQLLDAEQMLDMYVNIGMPDNYRHWSHGKQRERMGDAHTRGMMGLAYELVINSNPSISYCMITNSNMMQALVLAHAAQGHSAFFKNNIMFKDFTDADEILGDLRRLAHFVNDCEDKHGVDRVERILDACHALQNQSIDYAPRRGRKSLKQREAHKTAIHDARITNQDTVLEATSIKRPTEAFKSVSEESRDRPLDEQNLLRWIGNMAPHLEPWERQIILMFCDRAQYFYPQGQTKLMNEGFASYWHYKIMHDLHDLTLISDGMMFEFLESHSSVLGQHDFQDFNPYTLGFAIYMDLDRICKEPTDEDRLWFPDIAGDPDWLTVHKEAAFNYSDEAFIYQYLSPKVIRDFHMFALKNDEKESDLIVTAIHDDEGYKKIRATLAANYNIAERTPTIKPVFYDNHGDRSLYCNYTMYSGRPLDEKNAEQVMAHVYQLMGHPVVLTIIDEDRKVKSGFSCPPNHAVPKAVAEQLNFK